MRRFSFVLAASAAACFGLSQAAYAASIPLKAPPPPAPVFSWTGCYLGAFTGYKSGAVQEYFSGGPNWISSYDLIDGLAAGGEVGCQYQSGVWVFGVAGDGAWTNLSGKGFDPTNANFTLQADEHWFATVRGKVGFAINHWWGYFTAGWAWSEWKQQHYPTTNPAVSIEDTKTIDGFVVGVGMDYAFTNHWVFNTEFLYMDYGKRNWFPAEALGVCRINNTVFAGCSREIEHTNFFLKVGMKYLFNIL